MTVDNKTFYNSIETDRNRNLIAFLTMTLPKRSTKKRSKLLSKEDFKDLMTF